MMIEQGQMTDAFAGFRDQDTAFEFFGGKTWRQNERRQHSHYAYMPSPRVTQEAGRYLLYVEGVREPLVVQAR